jgi:hypothetical protein
MPANEFYFNERIGAKELALVALLDKAGEVPGSNEDYSLERIDWLDVVGPEAWNLLVTILPLTDTLTYRAGDDDIGERGDIRHGEVPLLDWTVPGWRIGLYCNKVVEVMEAGGGSPGGPLIFNW